MNLVLECANRILASHLSLCTSRSVSPDNVCSTMLRSWMHRSSFPCRRGISTDLLKFSWLIIILLQFPRKCNMTKDLVIKQLIRKQTSVRSEFDIDWTVTLNSPGNDVVKMWYNVRFLGYVELITIPFQNEAQSNKGDSNVLIEKKSNRFQVWNFRGTIKKPATLITCCRLKSIRCDVFTLLQLLYTSYIMCWVLTETAWTKDFVSNFLKLSKKHSCFLGLFVQKGIGSSLMSIDVNFFPMTSFSSLERLAPRKIMLRFVESTSPFTSTAWWEKQ